jgi:glycosyltransferase involved in cell wall biosynthesis
MTLIEHAARGTSTRGSASVSVVVTACGRAQDPSRVLEQVPEWVDEVVLVDGHASDDAIAAARAIRPNVRVVVAAAPGGRSAARTGFAAARGDCVVMLDAGASADAADITRFVGALEAGRASWSEAA